MTKCIDFCIIVWYNRGMKNNNLQQINLPTPQELAKKARDITVPLSLRVKENTLAVLDGLAEASGIKTGSLINSLLDTYAENYRNGYAQTLPIRNYLEKTALKFANLGNESLIIKVANNRRWEEGAGVLCETWDGDFDVKDALYEYEKGAEDGSLYYAINSGLSYDIVCSHKSKKVDLKNHRDVGAIGEMCVPKEKWPLVVAMVDAYINRLEKMGQLPNTLFDYGSIEKMVEIINATNDRREIALELAKLFADYLED